MKYVAERKLLYSEKGSNTKTEIVIKISEPFLLTENDVSFSTDGVAAGCCIVVDGLDGFDEVVYGVDSLQAVHLAADIEGFLKRLHTRFDLFWNTGEPYFEE